MLCRLLLLRHFFSLEAFSFAFVGAICRGFIMYCKGSRYHVQSRRDGCAAFQCHLCHPRDM